MKSTRMIIKTSRVKKLMEIVSKYPIGKSKHFIELDEESNKIFISNNKSDFVSIVDINSKKTEQIEIESPRNLIHSRDSNRLYVLSGNAGFRNRGTSKKISAIDLGTNRVIKEIGKNEGFGGMDANFKEHKIYATRHKKKKVTKIDEITLEVEKEINVKDEYKHITMNKNTKELILAGTFGKHTISKYDEKSEVVEKNFKQNHMGYEDTFSIKFYEQYDMILAYLNTSKPGAGQTMNSRIHTIKYKQPDSKNRFEDRDILEIYDMDQARKYVYYVALSWTKKNIIRRKSPEYTKEEFELDKKINPSDMIVNSKTGDLLLTGSEKKENFLYQIRIPS